MMTKLLFVLDFTVQSMLISDVRFNEIMANAQESIWI